MKGVSRYFGQAKQNVPAHERRVKILREKGWEVMGAYWISPYSGLKYTESLAITVEDLRGTFKPGYASREWRFV